MKDGIIKVDARGCACPEPVLMVKRAADGSPAEIAVELDNHTAVQNVTRFAGKAGYRVEQSEVNGNYTLRLIK